MHVLSFSIKYVLHRLGPLTLAWPRARIHLEIKRETASNYSMLITYSLSSAGKSHRSALNAAVGSLLMGGRKRCTVFEKLLSSTLSS